MSLVVLYTDPTLSRGKVSGDINFEDFLGCAESAVLFSYKPFRLQVYIFSIHVIATSATLAPCTLSMIVDYIIPFESKAASH